jgi:hypothetical protein
MIIATIPVIVMLVGLVLWTLTTGKLVEIGRLMFIIGMFWAIYATVGKTMKIG